MPGEQTKSRLAHWPGRNVPVIATPDVAIVGGGAAGLAAAVAVRRLGLSALLIERYGFCGGATVAGLSGTVCGLFSSGSRPEQIVFGFAGEFHARLRARGGAGAAFPFGMTALVPHDSFVWKELADAYLRDEGIDTLFHTEFFAALEAEGGAARTLILRAREGLVAVEPRVVIDASGDAEVVHTLQLRTDFGRDGVVQTPTMIFRLGGVDLPAFFALDQHELCKQIECAHVAGEYRLPRHHVYIFPLPNQREVLCNMTRVTFPDGGVPVGTRSGDMTYAEMEGRRQVREYWRFLRDHVFAFRDAYIVETGAQVGIRQSRSLIGMARLLNGDVLAGRKVPGAASHSAWPIEAHGAGVLKIEYLIDDYYDIPFETLVPQSIPNLLVAGRCLSAEHEALASARVTAQCLGMGYAAGAGAGLMLREGLASQQLSGLDVEAWMCELGLKTSRQR